MSRLTRSIGASTVAVLMLGGLVTASTAGATTAKCANAASNLAKISATETTVATQLASLQTKLAAATAAGHTKAVAVLNARITVLQDRETLLTARANAITVRCPQ